VADFAGGSVGEATVEARSVPAGPGSDGRLAAAVVAVPILSEALVSAIVAGDRRRAKALVAAIELVAIGRSADDPGGDSDR